MRLLMIGFAAFLGVGCVQSLSEDDSSSTGRASCTNEDRDACKIEGSQIGRPGVTVQLDQGTATFVDWLPKAGSPGEYVGFTLRLEGTSKDVNFVVKAGTEKFPGRGDFWKHVGVDCHGISHVDFGENAWPEDPSDPACDDPDGCPETGSGEGPFY